MGSLLVVAPAAMAVLLAAGCEFEFSVGDPPADELEIVDAVAALGIDDDGHAERETSEFDADTSEVFVVATVRGAPDGATVTSTWVHDPDVVFAETTIDLDPGESIPHFSFTRPDDGWPHGTYTVELVVDADDVEPVREDVAFAVSSDDADDADDADDHEDVADEPSEGAEEVVEELPEELPEESADAPDGAIVRPDGYPDDLPLPEVNGFITPLPDEDGLFATQLDAVDGDVVAFLDDELPAHGWTVHFREDDPDEGVVYFASKDGDELLLVVEPDPQVEERTLLSVAVDPDL